MLNLKQRLRKRRQRPPLTLPVSADDYAYDDTYTRSDNTKNNNNNYNGSISLTPFTSAGNHAVTPTDLLPLDESPPQQHHRHTPSTDSTNSSALFEANASISRLHSSPSTPTLSTVHQLHTQSLQHRHRQHITVDAKVVLVGSQAVGKTSIARRFVDRAFFGDSIQSTVGASLMTKRITIGNRTIRLQLWDTAGQERFRSMAPLFFRGSHAAICVYDITSEKSVDELRQWICDLKRFSTDANERRLIYVVGNKSDLAVSRRPLVSRQKAKDLIESLNSGGLDNGDDDYRDGMMIGNKIVLFNEEISAKSDNGGVDRLFYEIANRLLDNLACGVSDDSDSDFSFIESGKDADDGKVPVIGGNYCDAVCGATDLLRCRPS